MTYPTIRPALTLDFAKTQQLDPRITFSRSSSATYVGYDGLIKTAPDGVARFEYDSDGKCLGLLIEEARTNYMQYSTELDNAYWDLATGISKTANNAVSPDGNTTALLVQEDTSTGEHKWGRTLNVSVSNNCMSIFVKPNGKTKVGLAQGGSIGDLVAFDLTGSGSVLQGAGLIEQYPNGWYRITNVRSGSGNQTTFHLLNDADNAKSYTGDGTSGCWIWGYQKEAGTFPTSIIPTAGSTVTRAADVASITGTNFSSWYNQNQGAVLSTFKSPVPSGTTRYWMLITDGANSLSDGYRFAMSRVMAVTSSGGNAWSSSGDWLSTGYTQNAENRTAFGYDRVNDSNSFINNGAIQETNTSATDVSIAPTTITIGAAATQDNFAGHISRLAFYPERVSDESLEAITA